MTGKPASPTPSTALPAMAHILLVILLGLVSASSCGPLTGAPPTSENTSEEMAARQSLIRFLHNLEEGNYRGAAELYDGSYETMVAQNPTMDPTDHAALFRSACTINGAQCLAVRSARLDPIGSGSDGEVTFIVEFSRSDGSLFSLGPCCGGAADDVEPQTEFRFELRRTPDHRFKVLTPPVYLP